jgi:hypothetical protein
VTPRLWRLLLAGSVVVQLVALYWPQQVGGGGPPGTDKLVHALLFAAVAFTGRFAGVPVRWLAALLAAHAVVSELVQALLLPGRSGDPRDVFADLVGVAGGLLAARAAGARACDPAASAR